MEHILTPIINLSCAMIMFKVLLSSFKCTKIVCETSIATIFRPDESNSIFTSCKISLRASISIAPF